MTGKLTTKLNTIPPINNKAKTAPIRKIKRSHKNKTPLDYITQKNKTADIDYENISHTITSQEKIKWERVQAQLKVKLGNDVYSSWFGRCRLESISNSQLLLSVPTAFLRSWITSHYGEMLLQLWQKQIKSLLKIDIIVRSAMKAETSSLDDPEINVELTSPRGKQHKSGRAVGFGQSANLRAQNDANLKQKQQAFWQEKEKEEEKENNLVNNRMNEEYSGSPLDASFTFANFVEGESNRMALAAAHSVVEAQDATPQFNPLFIHASVGLGKTHLLQAIAWAANAKGTDMKILYLTAEYFMCKFASAIRDQSALSLKETWRDIDLLIIDDMQFLQGKAIQQEFCHLLNALINNAKQVVVAADRQPDKLESLDKRIKSRLKGGVSLEIRNPELKMRRQILEMRYLQAQREEKALSIDSDILDYVAAKVDSSCRDLEGAFNQLLIQHKFNSGEVGMDTIEKMLRHLVQSGEQKRVRIEDIQKIVSKHYNIAKTDLLSKRRTRIIVYPRQVSMYLAKNLTPRSLPEIGRQFGMRDHTTVLHAVKKIERLMSEDTKMVREMELLKRLVYDEQGI